jgi:hypothetical protein
LVHICGINWDHGKTASAAVLQALQKNGILIAFDGQVRNIDIHAESFLVLFSPPLNASAPPVSRTWVELVAEQLSGATVTTSPFTGGNGCIITGVGSTATPGQDVPVNGAFFRPRQQFITGDYRVVLRSDFVRDTKGRAVDGDHLPAWVPTTKTGDGIQGGTFESWFTVTGN